MSALKAFRWIAWIEGLSYLALLFVAMPLKYGLGIALAVRIAGAVHGALFLLFCAALFRVALEHRWTIGKAALAFLASLVPFGTFALDRALAREAAPPA